ncbi:uncharacterized protein K489DRAFT_47419 [Dissoconium aciculare CBS 342.82]|uniref:Uncharacterized protein n=1 Tax=Dissoconium aciculare CBS 342.82 TaxID=1314786 RepID=A0A6J3LZR4_9PEZI|nr:uncharacterized protein K489DRAFT_47419 [Dissoconium aciculare CBS 342.82]KAF1820122.1 hypothetical protein K489DRAFT_47419 [Dissoconium aciculare CBS 342.82]
MHTWMHGLHPEAVIGEHPRSFLFRDCRTHESEESRDLGGGGRVKGREGKGRRLIDLDRRGKKKIDRSRPGESIQRRKESIHKRKEGAGGVRITERQRSPQTFGSVVCTIRSDTID